MELDKSTIDAFERDGAVLVKGLFSDHLGDIAAGIDENMALPGVYASDNLCVGEGESGRFFDDYCNWTRISAFERVVRESPAASVAAQLMRSSTAQFFHDHVLVKEPGTSKPTPWHQDSPYYFVEGEQAVSFWTAVEPVPCSRTLRFVAGSHQWPKPVLPTRWLKGDSFYTGGDYIPAPDPDAEGMPIMEWDLQPGDAVAFNFKTLHGSHGNESASRRRAFSLRWVGDDARYVERPGPTSPPFPGHGMRAGQRLREDWFPVIFPPRQSRL